jgi:hypothetical protein
MPGDPEHTPSRPTIRTRFTRAQWIVIALCLVSWAISAAGYRVLMFAQLGHSSLMFMGIPTVLAIMLCLAPPAKSITGGIMKSITFALLIIAPLLGEGYLCILFASPIFYMLGAIIGAFADTARAKRRATLGCVAILLLPICLEGVTPQWSFNRTQTVAATAIVAASADQVEQALAQSPDVHTPLPRFLSIGFPRPIWARGQGLHPGDTRTIHFTGAEGDPPGDLTMRITASRPGLVHFQTVSDTSKLTQWIAWRSSQVEWRAIDATHTQVTWTIQFDRQLDPAWYFAPWERFAVRDAAQYLLHANVDTNHHEP